MVRCIDNEPVDGGRHMPLTINKTYEVLEESCGFYVMIDDINSRCAYRAERFKPVETNDEIE